MTPRFELAALSALAILSSCRTETPAPPPAPPRITGFTASPSRVEPGERARLSFTVEGAESVELRDQFGGIIAVDGDAADVLPTETSVYVLHATGPGGRDAAFARVQVGTVAESIFLVAVPPSVPAGDPVSLVFDAAGSSDLRLTDAEGTVVPVTGSSGLVSVTPTRSTRYTLSADPGAGRPRLTANVDVTVAPQIDRFTATPPAARPGGTITLAWDTRGASSVTLREASFGELVPSSTQTENGSFAFTVPATLPGDAGIPTPIGFPLSFSLVANAPAPAGVATREVRGAVGDGPLISAFVVPRFASAGKLMALTWVSTGDRVELEAGGRVVFTTTGPRARSHTLTLAAPATNLEYRLTAYDANGLSSSTRASVTIVPPPQALTFVAPASVADPSTDAQVSWTSSGASTLVIRAKDGPVLFSTENAAQLDAGNTRLRLGRSTTLVFEARNAAGELASLERRVNVTTPATVSASLEPATPGSDLTWSWDFAAQTASDVEGVPTAATPTPNATSFVDLSTDLDATELLVTDGNEQVIAFTPPQGFVFPAFDEPTSTFWVSTNGFVAFASTTVPRPANLDLETTTTVLPAKVAPFWDDLQVGPQGSIRWRVDGAFPRRLIIQWTNMLANGDPNSRLTFQVQLFETGHFRFVYRTLQNGSAMNARGEAATVGVSLGLGRFRSNFGFNAAVLSEGLELGWFRATTAAGNTVSRVARASTFTPFFRSGSGPWTAAPLTARVFVPESLVVSEAMPLPAAGVTAGRYLELYNPGSTPIDVGGLELRAVDAGSMPFVLPSTVVPAQGHLVLGETFVTSDNGGVPVELTAAADQLPAGVRGTMELRVPGAAAPVSFLTWGVDGGTTPTEGVSISGDPGAIRSAPSGRFVCNRGTTTFGPTLSVGTPGAANDSCYPYRVEPITLAWEDISGTGTRLFNGTDDLAYDDKVANVALAQGFPYFRATRSGMTVGTNGFIAMTLGTATASTNKVLPSSSNPTGTIAPYWDDIHRKSNAADASVYTERKNGYQVVQWHHYGTFSSVEVVDDFNFEVKLFDTGVIEFHYQSMVSGSVIDTSLGASATVWIEEPGGASALPISINRPAPRQNTAWRFTPQN